MFAYICYDAYVFLCTALLFDVCVVCINFVVSCL